MLAMTPKLFESSLPPRPPPAQQPPRSAPQERFQDWSRRQQPGGGRERGGSAAGPRCSMTAIAVQVVPRPSAIRVCPTMGEGRGFTPRAIAGGGPWVVGWWTRVRRRARPLLQACGARRKVGGKQPGGARAQVCSCGADCSRLRSRPCKPPRLLNFFCFSLGLPVPVG